MPSGAPPTLRVCLAALLVGCATTSGSGVADAPAVVECSFEKLSPETVRIPADGNVTWVNLAPDAQAFVVFPATITSGFTCGDDLEPYFHEAPEGYRSLPITAGMESERVELPCPLKPGRYAYEVWLMGAGFGTTDPDDAQQKLRGTLVVE